MGSRTDRVQITTIDRETQHAVTRHYNCIGEVSDGYHTFDELYLYRMLYNAAFFNQLTGDGYTGQDGGVYRVHKSRRHSDGQPCFGGGWFVVMAHLPTGQISNHYPEKYWDLFHIPEQDIADEWDGHTPTEAAERLQRYVLRGF